MEGQLKPRKSQIYCCNIFLPDVSLFPLLGPRDGDLGLVGSHTQKIFIQRSKQDSERCSW